MGSAPVLVQGNEARYLAKGSLNWLILGLNKLVGYKGPAIIPGVEGGTQMTEAAEGYASLGSADSPGLGSVFRVLTALFFIGAGIVRYKGLNTGAVATSTLALRLLENGSYNGTTYQAGLAQPSAPTIFTKEPGAGFSGTELIAGTRALVIWRIRSSTGARSIASLPSNVVVVQTGETIVITAPLTSSNGDDRWGIGAPQAGRGEFGPFFTLMEIPESSFVTISKTDGAITATDQTLTSASATFSAADIGKAVIVTGAGAAGADLTTTIASINSPTSVELTVAAGTTVAAANFMYGAIVNGIPRSVELEWSDGALAGQDLAPIDDFPPPPGLFGGTLNDTGFIDGCYGDVGAGQQPATLGATIAVSLPLRFESWPPDSLLFTPEPPTGVIGRQADGYAYRASARTLGAVTYTGGERPLSYQLRWPTAGCVAPHNMVIAEQGRLYIYTSQHGLARIGDGDEPDTEWAIPFWDDTEGWNPYEVVLGWDDDNQIVCACHRKTILPFNSANGHCCTPLDLTGKIRGNICAAVTGQLGELYLATKNVRSVSDVTTTNASPIITSPTAAFTADDVGMVVKLRQGSPGVGTLTTTILSVQSGTQATLAANVTWTGAGDTSIAIDTSIRLYRFNAGTGMVSTAITPFMETADESDGVFDVGGALTVDNITNPVVLKLLQGGRTSNVARTWTKYMPSVGFNHLATEKPNLINAKSHALLLQVTGTGGEVSLDSLFTVSESDAVTLAG